MVPLFADRSALYLFHGLEVALWHDAFEESGATLAIQVVLQAAEESHVFFDSVSAPDLSGT